MTAGRKMIPGKVTTGVCKNGKGGWRYWVRSNGRQTTGPTRSTEARAWADVAAHLKGRPPKKLKGWSRQGSLTRAERMDLGTCICCDAPRAGGTLRCVRHRKEDSDRQTARRRAKGQLPRDRFLRLQASAGYNGAKAEWGSTHNAKLAALGRCYCGLLLPCYHPTFEDYATARTEG